MKPKQRPLRGHRGDMSSYQPGGLATNLGSCPASGMVLLPALVHVLPRQGGLATNLGSCPTSRVVLLPVMNIALPGRAGAGSRVFLLPALRHVLPAR